MRFQTCVGWIQGKFNIKVKADLHMKEFGLKINQKGNFSRGF